MGANLPQPVVFLSVPKTVCASALNLGTFRNHLLGLLCQKVDFLLSVEAAPEPFLWRYDSLNFEFSDIFQRSALLRLAKAIDDIHRIHRVTGRFDILSRNIVTSDPSPCRQDHFRS